MTTTTDHLNRVQRAIDFIEDHLREDIAMEQIAKAACFSMWHFQKIFSSAVGDTVKEYVRKRRLTNALIELGSNDRRIIDIAFDYQFESQEAFSRAFKQVFGKTPGECRKERLTSITPFNKPRMTLAYLEHLYGGLTMNPSFVTIEHKKLVGLSTHFISALSAERNNHVLLPKLWDKFMAREHEIVKRKTPADIGLCEAITDEKIKTHADECFYMACTEVESFDNLPAGMVAKEIPGGRYAVFIHKGKLDNLEQTMSYIYGSWLPKSGEELRDAPDLEVYGPRFKFGDEGSELEIFIPVL